MLLTVTANPAVDRTLYVAQLELGAVHRTDQVCLSAGGKGLNVARAARSLGQEVLATGPLAGHSGRLVADLARQEGLAADWFWLEQGETRCSLLLTHQREDATVINEPGPSLEPQAWDEFAKHVLDRAGTARAVALSSSLPPGVAPEALAVLAQGLTERGVTAYVDTSGAALVAALQQPEGICIKVNRQELVEASGSAGGSEELVEVCWQLVRRGAAQVVVTLGGEGALAVSREGAWQAIAPRIEVRSTVGSGDSLTAGFACRRLQGASVAEALRFGVACGSANATTSYPGQFQRETALELEALVTIRQMI